MIKILCIIRTTELYMRSE